MKREVQLGTWKKYHSVFHCFTVYFSIQ